MTATAPTARPRLRDIVTPRRVVVSFLLSLAVMLLIVGFGKSVDAPTVVTGGGIEQVSPRPGELALRQDRITADLLDGMTGVLIIDGLEIPEDQLQRTPELGLVSFTPGPEHEIRELSPGAHSVTVVFWDQQTGRTPDSRRYSWSFQAH